MTQLFGRLKLANIFAVTIRFRGHGPDHWSKKGKKLGTFKALEHFDDFYKTVYGKAWPDIREALLQEKNKYIAVVNNFSDSDRICKELEALGAIDVQTIYNSQKEYLADQELLSEGMKGKKRKKQVKKKEMDKEMNSFLSNHQQSEFESVFPAGSNMEVKSLSDFVEEEKFDFKQMEPLQPVKLKSIESQVEINIDSSRIISASSGLSVSSLQEYVPTTKLKGLEDWILESDHYNYYKSGEDFTVTVEKELSLNIPEYLRLYTFEENNYTRFKSAKRGSTGVADYYLLDGGSILPVLALDLQSADRVLDMCAAPGGKSFIAIQTLLPSVIVMNDVVPKRIKRIQSIIDDFILEVDHWERRIMVTEQDARVIDDKDLFNKILVDVPCTNDRHSLHINDGNWFKGCYIKERLKLPELQCDILVNALKLVAPGGTVVYATCSLSPVQNDGVVQMALKKAFQEANVVMVVKDMTKVLKPLECLFNFGDFGLKYGHIVIPTMGNNWGPMYFCKMTKIR